MDVGRLGTAGRRRVVDPNGLLIGVPGERSEPSSRCEKEWLRDFMLLRLDDENLFRRPGR
jgi:hypothetical protein